MGLACDLDPQGKQCVAPLDQRAGGIRIKIAMLAALNPTRSFNELVARELRVAGIMEDALRGTST